MRPDLFIYKKMFYLFKNAKEAAQIPLTVKMAIIVLTTNAVPVLLKNLLWC